MKKPIFKHKVPVPIVALIIPVALGMGYLAHHDEPAMEAVPVPSHAMDQIRQQHYEFTRPLLLTNVSGEDPRLEPLKETIQAYIDSRVQSGILQTASVYLRVLNTGAWMGVNEKEQYSPGSLLKVPLMIYCMKVSENDPAFLDKKVRFDGPHDTHRLPSIIYQQLIEGKTYTVRELIRHMIVYSDNDATILLNNLVGNADSQVFEDIGLPKPDPSANDYFISPELYSRFFRLLFNATYLSAAGSDQALKLMSESAFRDGIVRTLPATMAVPRKFGEREIGGVKQFHEFGIVYSGNEPYLLGVMTKGADMAELTNVTSDISGIVFKSLNREKTAL